MTHESFIEAKVTLTSFMKLRTCNHGENEKETKKEMGLVISVNIGSHLSLGAGLGFFRSYTQSTGLNGRTTRMPPLSKSQSQCPAPEGPGEH